MRFAVLTLLAAGVLGCQPPDDLEAIEITGYLDETRVSWTQRDGETIAAGSEGAASAGSVVRLENLDTGALGESRVTEIGSFLVAVAAESGQTVELSVADAHPDDAQDHVVDEPPPFPTPSIAEAIEVGDHPGLVDVLLVFDPPTGPGHTWMVNHSLDLGAVLLDLHLDGAEHTGRIEGEAGDALLLWWVPAGGPESQPLELVVGP